MLYISDKNAVILFWSLSVTFLIWASRVERYYRREQVWLMMGKIKSGQKGFSRKLIYDKVTKMVYRHIAILLMTRQSDLARSSTVRKHYNTITTNFSTLSGLSITMRYQGVSSFCLVLFSIEIEFFFLREEEAKNQFLTAQSLMDPITALLRKEHNFIKAISSSLIFFVFNKKYYSTISAQVFLRQVAQLLLFSVSKLVFKRSCNFSRSMRWFSLAFFQDVLLSVDFEGMNQMISLMRVKGFFKNKLCPCRKDSSWKSCSDMSNSFHYFRSSTMKHSKNSSFFTASNALRIQEGSFCLPENRGIIFTYSLFCTAFIFQYVSVVVICFNFQTDYFYLLPSTNSSRSNLSMALDGLSEFDLLRGNLEVRSSFLAELDLNISCYLRYCSNVVSSRVTNVKILLNMLYIWFYYFRTPINKLFGLPIKAWFI